MTLRTRPALTSLALLLAAAAAPAQQAADPAAPAPSTASAANPRMPGSAYASDGSSMLPYTTHGYLGIDVGQARFHNPCGAGGYACGRAKVSGYFYTGGLFNDWLGVELGYLNSGKADRAGGRTQAQGLGASLLLRAPMGPFSAFVKVGAMYAQTRVSTGPLSDVAAGKRRSWAPSVGAGLGYDFTPRQGLVLAWSRARMRFPGSDDRQDVDNTSLGYVYRF